MEDFSQLLNQYIRRVGVSDAELARAVGVSRQTIFRWREGVTGRPRHREDVQAIARKLRLTPAERDALLLAAGFHPQETIAGPVSLPPAETPVAETPPPPKAGASGQRLPFGRWVALLAGLLLAATPVVFWLWPGAGQPDQPDIKAAPGETLVLVAQFANYAGNQIGYNVAGRLAEALEQEIKAGQLQSLRVAVWPTVIDTPQAAEQAGQAAGATLVVYGEYDVGRVLVKFARPGSRTGLVEPVVEEEVTGVPELSTTINTGVPRQVQSLALLALGQIFLTQNRPEQALSLLNQARQKIETGPPVDPQTRAVLHFYLGVAHQKLTPPELDRAITAYTKAITIWPAMLSSRLNRIAAYQQRRRPGDLDQALLDADEVIKSAPGWAPAFNNRAAIRIAQGGAKNGNLAAADLEQALALDPALPEAYFNRAYLYLKQGGSITKAAPDLLKATELRPDYGEALNMLCWGYAVETKPDTALPYCHRAVEAGPEQAGFRESRGLAYAQLGQNTAAIADFEAYTDWLQQQPDQAQYVDDLARHREWIEQLKAGQNPLTPSVLDGLRRAFRW